MAGGTCRMIANNPSACVAHAQAAVEEIKQASNALVESSMQIAASATSYWDALKNTCQCPHSSATEVLMASLDARVHAREGIKVRQVLVDVLAPSQPLHPSANNMQLVAWANESLCSMGSPPPPTLICRHKMIKQRWHTT